MVSLTMLLIFVSVLFFKASPRKHTRQTVRVKREPAYRRNGSRLF